MKKKKTTYKPFDAAAYLDNDAVIAEYLSAAAEDPNPDVFVAALGDVAKARGMAQIAKDSGLGRESLYKTLSAGAHPRFETINSVLHALGVKFAVVAEHGELSGRRATLRQHHPPRIVVDSAGNRNYFGTRFRATHGQLTSMIEIHRWRGPEVRRP